MQNIIKAFFLNGYRIIYAYFAWMRKYAKNREKYDINLKYSKLHRLCERLSKSLNADITVKGLENIPDETACYLSNHISMTDPLIYLSVFHKATTFVCKKEIEKYPFVAKCINCIEGEFIDRQDLKSSLRTMMKVEKDLRTRKKSWLIFPEGTRNKDRKALLLDFHYGTFKAPTKAKVPLVPCVVYGSHRLIFYKTKFKRYPIYVEFGKPLYPEEYENMSTQEVAKNIQSRVQTMLSYHARQEDKEALMKLLKNKYKETM